MNLVAVVLPEQLGSLNFLFRGVESLKDYTRGDFMTFQFDNGNGNVDIISKKNITVVLQGRKDMSLEVRKSLMDSIIGECPGGNELGSFFSSNTLLGRFRTFQMLYVKDGSFWIISKLFPDEADLHFAKLSTGITIIRWGSFIHFSCRLQLTLLISAYFITSEMDTTMPNLKKENYRTFLQ